MVKEFCNLVRNNGDMKMNQLLYVVHYQLFTHRLVGWWVVGGTVVDGLIKLNHGTKDWTLFGRRNKFSLHFLIVLLRRVHCQWVPLLPSAPFSKAPGIFGVLDVFSSNREMNVYYEIFVSVFAGLSLHNHHSELMLMHWQTKGKH